MENESSNLLNLFWKLHIKLVSSSCVQVTGVQQSPLEVIVMKDGKELKIDKDVSLNIQGENVGLTVINPRREKSGTYKVILRNAQGQDERDIQVNIMGII